MATFDSYHLTPADCIVGMDATGHYWLAIYGFLLEKGFTVKVINPIVTDAYRNMQVRKVKTDPIDAMVIAKVLIWGNTSNPPPPAEGPLPFVSCAASVPMRWTPAATSNGKPSPFLTRSSPSTRPSSPTHSGSPHGKC